MNFWTFLDRNIGEIGWVVVTLAVLGSITFRASGSDGCRVHVGAEMAQDGGAP